MRSRYPVVSLVIGAALAASAQNSSPDSSKSDSPNPANSQQAPVLVTPSQTAPPEAAKEQPSASTRQVSVPAGTEVLLQLKNAIDTKHARVGDGVYCQTTFPVVIDNTIIIPPGSYVKGEITKVQRAGRISGRAEILFRFDSLIFPTGYTVAMPGSLHGDPGTRNGKLADEEGTVTTDGHDKLSKLPDVGRDTAYGSVAGGVATGSINGARIGGGIGALAGLATMFSRGSDVRIEPGSALTMRLERPLVVDVSANNAAADTRVVPRQTNNRLPMPSEPKPQ